MSHPVPYVPIATGWVDSPVDVAATLDALADTQAVPPYFGAAAPGLVLDGADDDRPVFFQDAEQKILGRVLSSWNQGSVGTCVSFGYGRGAQDLLLLEIAAGQAEEWPGAEVATEPIYGGSRVEVGGGRISGDGSVGAWAAKWVKEWGVVVRGKYGPHDLTRYSGDLSRRWGRDGVPAEIEALARLHPVKAVALVENAAQLWAALGNGYPVPVCSDQGFTSELVGGFCEPSGSWAHCCLPETLIAGPTYRRADEVSVGDVVYGHDGEAHRVSEVHRRQFRGCLARIKACGMPAVSFTDEHPVLVYRRARKGVGTRAVSLAVGGMAEESSSPARWRSMTFVPTWVAAKDVRPGDNLVMPNVDFGPTVVPEWCRPEAPQATSRLAAIRPCEELAWLFGVFVGNGHATAGHKIQFTMSAKAPVERIVEAVRLLGVEPTVDRHPTFVRIHAYSAVLADSFLAWFGHGAQNKRFPSWLLTWDITAVLDGLMTADGCTYKGRSFHTTVSPVLAQQVRLMLGSAGERPAAFTKRPSKTGYANGKTQYVTQWTPGATDRKVRNMNGFTMYRVDSVMFIPHEGEVFNYEVEDCHSYVADGVAVHNCMVFRARFVHPDKGRCFVIQNSWGPYLRGERRFKYRASDGTVQEKELPEGCFCVAEAVAGRMLRQRDSFALSDFSGFPARPRLLDWLV